MLIENFLAKVTVKLFILKIRNQSNCLPVVENFKDFFYYSAKSRYCQEWQKDVALEINDPAEKHCSSARAASEEVSKNVTRNLVLHCKVM